MFALEDAVLNVVFLVEMTIFFVFWRSFQWFLGFLMAKSLVCLFFLVFVALLNGFEGGFYLHRISQVPFFGE